MHIIKLLACVAFGITTVRGDGAAITNAISSIQNATIDLADTVDKWPGDLLGSLPISGKSISLLVTINKATVVAHQSANLSDIEAFTVGLATITLASKVNTTLNTIIAAKPKFDRLLILDPITLFSLWAEKVASADFSNAVIEKLPDNLKTLGGQLASQIDASFTQAIDVYK
jgi:hypothetical protein